MVIVGPHCRDQPLTPPCPSTAFRTDTGISQKKHNNTDHERHDDAFGAIGDASWDQFVVNAELFGVTGSFNDDDYTTNTNFNLADFKELALEAQRISAEILGVCVLFLSLLTVITDINVKLFFVRLLLTILTKRNMVSMTVVLMKRISKLF